MAYVRADSVTERVVEYIDHNYSTQISLRNVAEALGYSASYLTTAFRKTTGMPITAWIIKRRILAAKELLGNDGVTVAHVCEAVGFCDLCYFYRQFVRHVGVTPGRFRSAHPTRESGS